MPTLIHGAPTPVLSSGGGVFRLQRILCAVDFSELSTAAMTEAVKLARASGAEITALTVLPDVSGAAISDAGARSAVLQDMEPFLQPARAAGARLRAVVAGGDAAHEIVAAATASEVDLIAMGTHGRSGLERWALGSVAEAVLRQAPCPVLTVAAVPPERPLGPPSTIVCAVELDAAGAATLEYALGLAQATGRGVTFVHVIEGLARFEAAVFRTLGGWAEARRQLEQDARDRLRSAAAAAVGDRCYVAVVVSSGKPYYEILRVADERAASLIVIGIHDSAPQRRRSFGANAQHVIREAECPVLTVRGG